MKIKTFIINLKSNISRREYMEKLCQEYKDILDVEFVDAVNGYQFSEEEICDIYNRDIAIENIGRELKKGEVGCLLSHINVYNRILSEKISYALILEDDIVFEDRIRDIMAKIHQYPNSWDIILYGHYSYYLNGEEISSPISIWNKPHRLDKNNALYRLSSYGYGTHGYLISYSGTLKLVDILKKIYAPIDHYTGNRTLINLYAVYPTVIKVNTCFDSSINTNSGKTPFIKRFKFIWKIRSFMYKFFSK